MQVREAGGMVTLGVVVTGKRVRLWVRGYRARHFAEQAGTHFSGPSLPTKGRGPASGLAIALGVARAYGGTIDVHCARGGRVRHGTAGRNRSRYSGMSMSQDLPILVVEGDPGPARGVCDTLLLAGKTVVSSPGGNAGRWRAAGGTVGIAGGQRRAHDADGRDCMLKESPGRPTRWWC